MPATNNKKTTSKKAPEHAPKKASSSGGKASAASKNGTSGSKSAPRTVGSKSTAQKNNVRPQTNAPAEEPKRPIRREVWACVCLLIGVLSLLGYFGAASFLHRILFTPIKGLIGYGYIVFPPCMFVCFWILMFHHGRPVRLRTGLALSIPLCIGALVHIINKKAFDFANFGISAKALYASGKSYSSGGVLCGFIGSGLSSLISSVGAVLVLIAILLGALIVVFKISPAKIAENAKNRERPRYVPEPEPERKPRHSASAAFSEPEATYKAVPDPVTKVVEPITNVPTPKGKAPKLVSESDIDVPLDGGKNAEPKKKAGFFNITPNVRTIDSLFVSPDDVPAREEEETPDIPFFDDEPLGEEESFANSSAANARVPRPADDLPAAHGFSNTIKDESKPEQSTKFHESEASPVSIEEAARIAGVSPELAPQKEEDPLFPSDRPRFLKNENTGHVASSSVKIPMPLDDIDSDKADKGNSGSENSLIDFEINTSAKSKSDAYIFPPVELLNLGKTGGGESASQTSFYAERLSATLQSFGVNAKVVDIISGPTVTRYDLELAAGVKLSRITGLSDDIALSLGVSGVRIAPIPGRSATVGVEVPNSNVSTVYLRSLVDSQTFRDAKSRLTFAIGEDIGGNTVVGNIAKLPHLLIAGTTGSGKSVCMNCLILSLLYKSSPQEVQFIMVDPKRVELGIYNGIPHLRIPVVTDPKKAAGALQWAVIQMLKRYGLFQEAGVRELSAYNSICEANGEERLPQLVVIIDELADLMFVASKEVEESICRIAQMGRAAGIHLVIATQRPSADVITGLMKANIPSRISFAVSSAMESRIILDQTGAEKLLGQGDMLYSPIGSGKPVRVQGAFVTDDERERIVNFIKSGTGPSYDEEAMHEIEKAAAQSSSGGKASSAADDDDGDDASGMFDELLPQAVDVVLDAKMCSVSLLQRRVKLGYSRAARIVDQMEELGIVGPHEGSKPRQVLITREQWIHMQSVSGNAPAEVINSPASEGEE